MVSISDMFDLERPLTADERRLVDDLTAMRGAAALSKVVKPNFRDGRFPDFRNAK